MKFSKKAIIPLSLSTALLMAACGDAKDEVKKEADEQTTETIKEATQDESEQLEKSEEPKEPLKTIMLIPASYLRF